MTVKFKCDTSNSFNLLTKEGIREWRGAGGGFDMLKEGGGNGNVEEEC